MDVPNKTSCFRYQFGHLGISKYVHLNQDYELTCNYRQKVSWWILTRCQVSLVEDDGPGRPSTTAPPKENMIWDEADVECCNKK